MARILIAEDDDAIRRLLIRALGDDGHELTTTADGGAALEALHQPGSKFDLLLADVKMPVMDGVALALAAGRDHPAMPINVSAPTASTPWCMTCSPSRSRSIRSKARCAKRW
jgi:CheY-like chemotaxis protein